jgi:transposase
MFATYTSGFRENLVRRLTGPSAMSLRALAAESGVAHTTLSRWLRGASTLPAMNAKNESDTTPKSTRQWTAEEKFAVVMEAAAISADELGAFQRNRGLRSSDLGVWRQQIFAALSDRKADRRRAAAEEGRVKNLQRELDRKDKKLRAAEALLDLQKKVREIWGDEGEFTPPKSER